MADDVLRVFDQQRAAFDRLSSRVDAIAAKLDALPSQTLLEAQKANADVVRALNRRAQAEEDKARRKEHRAQMCDALWFNHIPHLAWIVPILFVGLLAVATLFLAKPLSQSDTLCGWMGGISGQTTEKSSYCVLWR